MGSRELTDEIRCILVVPQSSVVSLLTNEFFEVKQTVITRRNQLLMDFEGRFPYGLVSEVSFREVCIAYEEAILGIH
jgi:hypothetical protein